MKVFARSRLSTARSLRRISDWNCIIKLFTDAPPSTRRTLSGSPASFSIASVITRDYGGWTQTLVVDRGSDSGIKKYMPVIVPTGLVGFVSEVYENSARVQLLLDPRTSVGGIVARPASRVVAMVSGNSSEPGKLSFVNLPREADVIKGDTIVASGYGGVYPKGMVIGTVEQVDVDSIGGTQVARIVPAADFSHLEEVFIITDHIQRATPESILVKPPKKEPPMNPNKHQAGEKE